MVSAAGSFQSGEKGIKMRMILVRSLGRLYNVNDELFTQNLSVLLCKMVLNPGATELQIIVINLQYIFPSNNSHREAKTSYNLVGLALNHQQNMKFFPLRRNQQLLVL